MRRLARQQALVTWSRDLEPLAAMLLGDPAQAGAVVSDVRVRLGGRGWGRPRTAEGLRDAAVRAVLRAARRQRSPWRRDDPLARPTGPLREVLALRLTVGGPPPAVAHLLDLPVGTVVSREADGLRQAGVPDLAALRTQVTAWQQAHPAPVAGPTTPAAGAPARTVVGLLAAAAVAGAAVLLVAAMPAPDRSPVPTRPEPPEVRPLPPLPRATTKGCADPRAEALCARPPTSRPLPAAEGADVRQGLPFWPFATDRAAADWAADPSALPWAGDAGQVAQHLVDDLLAVPRVRARVIGGGLVSLVGGSGEVGRVRLVRLGRGALRPWSVVGVESAAVALEPVASLSPGTPVRGSAGGPVDVRLLTPAGRELGRAAGLGLPLRGAADWSVAAVVARRRDGSGLALQPVRRSGSVDPGLPAPGATFVSLVDGTVRLHDALDGTMLLQVSSPEGAARDSDPSRGGRDAVVFVRTEADGCTSSVLRAALDRGAGGTTVQPAPLVRRLPRLSASAQWLGWVEAPCTGGDATLVLRGPDARVRRLPLGDLAVSRLEVRDDGGAVVQLRGPDRVLVLPAAATALPAPLAPPAGCRDTAASAAADAVLVWERCGSTARPVLVSRDGTRSPLGPPGPPILESAVVASGDGPLVLARTATGAVVRLVAGRLVPVLPACRAAPGCVTSLDW